MSAKSVLGTLAATLSQISAKGEICWTTQSLNVILSRILKV
jgi:hypothetical protein